VAECRRETHSANFGCSVHSFACVSFPAAPILVYGVKPYRRRSPWSAKNSFGWPEPGNGRAARLWLNCFTWFIACVWFEWIACSRVSSDWFEFNARRRSSTAWRAAEQHSSPIKRTHPRIRENKRMVLYSIPHRAVSDPWRLISCDPSQTEWRGRAQSSPRGSGVLKPNAILRHQLLGLGINRVGCQGRGDGFAALDPGSNFLVQGEELGKQIFFRVEAVGGENGGRASTSAIRAGCPGL